MSGSLEGLRADLDSIDSQIVSLLGQRQQVVGEIGDVKREAGLDAYQPGRHQEVLDKVKAMAGLLGADPAQVVAVYTNILDMSVAQQRALSNSSPLAY